jgi:hypothetical protein
MMLPTARPSRMHRIVAAMVTKPFATYRDESRTSVLPIPVK